ncbi:HAD family hydrolase [Streptomyces glomeratus]|uniref:HAD family hydrolase n=1 Tax=Streptomyces glomeratus TaxID=284452 RepID=UPI001F2BDA6B|nr:HAD-IA family hydrolase [Streptomyces glomeratus]MCF1511239.1 HAD-IA family hydrolase [Streptomyces glomeratus]
MTSDTTQADQNAEEIGQLRELIGPVRCVLFDFDGPVCRLFAGHSAEGVAQDLVEWLEGQGLQGLLTEEERVHPDPMAVLHAVNRRRPHSDLVAELEERLTRQELKAVVSAWPTAYADPLIRTWTARGARLAIATNNSARTAVSYLDDRDLTGCFARNVYGRTRDLHHLKPDPHCLNRALSAMGASPPTALMIGDTPSDLQAARQAGVPFLGYAGSSHQEKALREAGAECVLTSLKPVLRILRERP